MKQMALQPETDLQTLGIHASGRLSFRRDTSPASGLVRLGLPILSLGQKQGRELPIQFQRGLMPP